MPDTKRASAESPMTELKGWKFHTLTVPYLSVTGLNESILLLGDLLVLWHPPRCKGYDEMVLQLLTKSIRKRLRVSPEAVTVTTNTSVPQTAEQMCRSQRVQWR